VEEPQSGVHSPGRMIQRVQATLLASVPTIACALQHCRPAEPVPVAQDTVGRRQIAIVPHCAAFSIFCVPHPSTPFFLTRPSSNRDILSLLFTHLDPVLHLFRLRSSLCEVVI
jgi:hypothetical protein